MATKIPQPTSGKRNHGNPPPVNAQITIRTAFSVAHWTACATNTFVRRRFRRPTTPKATAALGCCAVAVIEVAPARAWLQDATGVAGVGDERQADRRPRLHAACEVDGVVAGTDERGRGLLRPGTGAAHRDDAAVGGERLVAGAELGERQVQRLGRVADLPLVR